MAHAGVALQIALLAAIISLKEWPPQWVPNIQLLGIQLSKVWMAFIGFALIWLAIHIYVRWQLRNRRWAAGQAEGLERILGKWGTRSPSMEELRLYIPESKNRSLFVRIVLKLLRCTSVTIDLLLIPFFPGSIPADQQRDAFPEGIVNEVKKRESCLPIFLGELLLWLGSVLVLGLVLCRTLAGASRLSACS